MLQLFIGKLIVLKIMTNVKKEKMIIKKKKWKPKGSSKLWEIDKEII